MISMFKKNVFFLLFIFVSANLIGQEQECVVNNININSKNQDFGMVHYSDSLVLFSSSRRDRSIKQRKWSGNHQPYLELYKAKLTKDGNFDSVVRFSDKVNTKYHDADLVFTKDENTIYFSRSNYYKKKYVTDSLGRNLIELYRAEKDSVGEWEIFEMPFNNRNYQTGHASLSEDETKLYFVSDMPGGYGKTDLYVVDINPDGSYGTPKNLGPNVNTEGKEMFPYVWKNELYFSSDGYAIGQGGLDVFMVDLVDHLPTKSVVNLARPLNSYSDDFGIAFNKTKNKGYFSSNRPGGKGDDDIYTFEFACSQIIKGIAHELETEVDTITTVTLFTKDNKQLDETIVYSKGEETSIDSTLVVGKEQDSIYKSQISSIVLDSARVFLLDENNLKLDSVVTNAQGEFQFAVDCSMNYKLVAEKEQYEGTELMIATTENNLDTIPADLFLTPSDIILTRGEMMLRVDPIYYDFDKTNIREESFNAAKRVVQLMRKYPHIKVHIKAHTDSRGRAEYNLSLSERRAAVLRVGIIQNGIEASRISSKGYGETEPINKCEDGVKCTEEEYQENRRIEFVITNPDEHKEEQTAEEMMLEDSKNLDIEVDKKK